MSQNTSVNYRKVVTLRGLMHKAQIRSNLVGIITSGTILTVLGLFALVNLADHNQKLVSRVLSYTLEAAVVFKDSDAIREGINLILETEKLSEVVVFDEYGKTLYEWNASSKTQWGQIERQLLGLILDQPRIVPVRHNGEQVGELQIYTDGSVFFIFMMCGVLAVFFSLIISTLGANIEGGRIHSFICKSVQELASIARKIARERSFKLRAPLSSIYEIRELAEDLNILLDEIETWEGHLQQENTSLSYKANHDSLTGVSNRAYFERVLSQQVISAREKGRRLALLYIDGYQFKSINDTFGHAAGDEVLVTTAKRLGALIREQDQLARLGGDEFAILIQPLQQDQDLERMASKIVDAMSHPIILESGERVSFSLTIGVATFPQQGETPKALMQAADDAMYTAKKNEKNFHIS
ncbi:diguanylate cyclase domain-containing protein [Nitrincola iocasae]|uniref:Diguanylate cyclase n=1 Tax=Nitrincola iocasae TaxID=2614693 RepID=A0A5J6LEV1_9GAMM|nr:diguanylate cyclase [Nitrincola iocasae]QEW07150.1 diguanylate cyclase [Nitrincola iocasae]